MYVYIYRERDSVKNKHKKVVNENWICCFHIPVNQYSQWCMLLWCKNNITILSQRLSGTLTLCRLGGEKKSLSCYVWSLSGRYSLWCFNSKKFERLNSNRKWDQHQLKFDMFILCWPLFPLFHFSFSPQVGSMGNTVCVSRAAIWEQEKGGAGTCCIIIRREKGGGWLKQVYIMKSSHRMVEKTTMLISSHCQWSFVIDGSAVSPGCKCYTTLKDRQSLQVNAGMHFFMCCCLRFLTMIVCTIFANRIPEWSRLVSCTQALMWFVYLLRSNR